MTLLHVDKRSQIHLIIITIYINTIHTLHFWRIKSKCRSLTELLSSYFN